MPKKISNRELKKLPVTKLVLKKDREWGEYQVRVYRGSHFDEGSTFHTDDKEDAVRTMAAMKKEFGLSGLAGRRRRRRSRLGESIIPSKGEVGTAVLFTVIGIAIIGGAMFLLPLLKPVSEQDKQAALLRASQK